jgi:hypothetical protein
VVRDGPAEPEIHRVGLAERAGRTVEVALAHAGAGRFVGIVCPTRRRRELEQALADNSVEWSSADRGELSTSINVVSPQDGEGPGVRRRGRPSSPRTSSRGRTRAPLALRGADPHDGRLDVVCVGEPVPLGLPSGRGPIPSTPMASPTPDARRLASTWPAGWRASAPPSAWPSVLATWRSWAGPSDT